MRRSGPVRWIQVLLLLHAVVALVLGFVLKSTVSPPTVERSGVDAQLVAVSCGGLGHCHAVAAGGQVRVESGDTWATEDSGTNRNLHGLSCPDAGHCWAVGDGGTVIRSEAGAWSAQASGTTFGPFRVDFPPAGRCPPAGQGCVGESLIARACA